MLLSRGAAAETPPRLRDALARVPAQADVWSCGANCAARALWLSGRPVPDYDTFLRGCPQSFGPQTPTHAHPLARMWGLRWVVRHLVPPVGPHPHLLAAYLSSGGRAGDAAQVLTFQDFAACQTTAGELLGQGAPLIALWYHTPFRAHYVVVDRPASGELWSIINNGRRHLLSAVQMAELMDCARCPWRRCVGLERFNIIALPRR